MPGIDGVCAGTVRWPSWPLSGRKGPQSGEWDLSKLLNRDRKGKEAPQGQRPSSGWRGLGCPQASIFFKRNCEGRKGGKGGWH